AAPDGHVNVTGLGDSSVPRNISAHVVSVGGVLFKSAGYLTTAADCGVLIVFDSATAVTLTLPAVAPFAASPVEPSQWSIEVQNIGTGILTVSRNGLTIDGAASNLTVYPGHGVSIRSDGSTYFTSRGMASDADVTFTDITSGNVSTTRHGFAPKAPNNATKYLDGTGVYSTPAGAAQPTFVDGETPTGTI